MDVKHHAGIDLHVHSKASDGSASSIEILNSAQKRGIGAISITDHDSVEGVREVLQNGIPSGVKFLTGIEISASPPEEFPCSGSFHMLGYGIRINDSEFNETLEKLRQARKTRNPRIVERLNRMGIDLSLEEVETTAGGAQTGRPHIAKTMVAKGFVSSINEAFDRYIGKGRPAYVEKYRLGCGAAIEMIIKAGGIPVLAHPVLIKPVDDRPIDRLIHILKSMGLRGIEVYYPEHSLRQTDYYARLATRYGLLMTGGTDYHGSLKPDIELGCGRGDFFVPYRLYEQLIQEVGCDHD